MPRKQKKYHYIYKTTNIITNKYYIGMHSTDDLDDGYVGSGKKLWYSVNKYRKENHKKEILEYLPNRKELSNREKGLGNQNSQFGTCWITDGNVNKKVKKEILIIESGWVLGRTIKK